MPPDIATVFSLSRDASSRPPITARPVHSEWPMMPPTVTVIERQRTRQGQAMMHTCSDATQRPGIILSHTPPASVRHANTQHDTMQRHSVSQTATSVSATNTTQHNRAAAPHSPSQDGTPPPPLTRLPSSRHRHTAKGVLCSSEGNGRDLGAVTPLRQERQCERLRHDRHHAVPQVLLRRRLVVSARLHITTVHLKNTPHHTGGQQLHTCGVGGGATQARSARIVLTGSVVDGSVTTRTPGPCCRAPPPLRAAHQTVHCSVKREYQSCSDEQGSTTTIAAPTNANNTHTPRRATTPHPLFMPRESFSSL